MSENDLKYLIDDLKESKQNFVESDSQLRAAQAQIFKTQRQLLLNKREQERIKNEIQTISQDIRQQLGVVKKLSVDVGDQKRLLQKRLKSILSWQNQNLAHYLFTASSIADLDRNFKALVQLSRGDLYLIQNFTSNKKKLIQNQSSLKKKLKQLAVQKDQLKNTEANLAKLNVEQEQSISSLSLNKRDQLEKLLQIRQLISNEIKNVELSESLRDSIADSIKANFFELKNKLNFPVNKAKIYRDFGPYSMSSGEIHLSSKGVFFAAKNNTDVLAVAEANVAYVGKLQYYGNTIILDHGDNFYSVYAHLSSFEVSLNERVKAGTTLGQVGEFATEQISGLYFELRHFSEPLNPMDWLSNSIQLGYTNKSNDKVTR